MKTLRSRVSGRIRELLGIRDIGPMEAAIPLVATNEGWTVVQIGAHVGNTPNDPLYAWFGPRRKQWFRAGTLLLVEPHAEHFEMLRRNYQGVEGVRFERAAVAERTGLATLHFLPANVDTGRFPEWADQLGSLKVERMEEMWTRWEGRWASSEFQDFYLANRIEEPVPCFSLSDLLLRHRIDSVDLLQIDVEGYEWEILSTFDFSSIPVRLLHFESALLFERKPILVKCLEDYGYKTSERGDDTFAWKLSDKGFNRSWRPGIRAAYRAVCQALNVGPLLRGDR